MSSDLLEAFQATMGVLAALSPRPWCIRASHAVPYGRVYRQWDTRGRLMVWANRGEIADLPRREWGGAVLLDGVIDSFALTAIPVVLE